VTFIADTGEDRRSACRDRPGSRATAAPSSGRSSSVCARAKEFLDDGALLDGARAAADRAGQPLRAATELDSAVDAFCDKLAAGATQAIRWTKTTVNIELKRHRPCADGPGLAYEALTAQSLITPTAVAAFREKPPKFSGM